MIRWPQSIQCQVALRLTLVFLLGTAAGVAALLLEGTQGAAAGTGEDLAHDLLREFIFDIAWIVPLFVAGTLAVGVWSIRNALKPLRAVSARAAAIAPDATGVRLPTERLPSELVPLVVAVNRALERLEQGFATQRQFTANAAHELRTPLAILTAGLEALDQSPEVAALRSDADRMNRLVAQLLAVARLDALPEKANGIVDLVATAAAVVAYLAPWAIEQGVTVGFDAPGMDVGVRGNANAIADAPRNLVENAVSFSPRGIEVVVAVLAGGKLTVSDDGPASLQPTERTCSSGSGEGRDIYTPAAQDLRPQLRQAPRRSREAQRALARTGRTVAVTAREGYSSRLINRRSFGWRRMASSSQTFGYECAEPVRFGRMLL